MAFDDDAVSIGAHDTDAVFFKRFDQHQQRKTLRNLEKTISRLDEEKKSLTAEMMQTADPKKAMDLHAKIASVSSELEEAEQRWCELQQELGEW